MGSDITNLCNRSAVGIKLPEKSISPEYNPASKIFVGKISSRNSISNNSVSHLQNKAEYPPISFSLKNDSVDRGIPKEKYSCSF
jgi:hypothetical protein